MTDILSTIAAENGIIENTDTPKTDTNTQADTTDAPEEDKVTFAELNIAKPILTALDRIGYTNPTPIQAQAIPFALQGRDLLLSAQTGSGKTAAFVIPVLDRLSRATSFDKLTKALILTPTRELAQQVHDSVRTYSKDMRGLFCVPLVGGAPYNGQITALRKGVQVIVATPGRLLDHIKAGRVDLSNLEALVLDEADRMLDMGFADDISDILSAAPTDRQTIMCSATWDGPVGKIAASFTKNPERVSIKVESAHIEEKCTTVMILITKTNYLIKLFASKKWIRSLSLQQLSVVPKNWPNHYKSKVIKPASCTVTYHKISVTASSKTCAMANVKS